MVQVTRMPRTSIAERISWIACAALLAVAPKAALAQDNEDGFNKGGDDAIAADKQAAEERKTGAKMPGEKNKKAEEETAAAKAAAAANDPREDPTKSYYFVGFRFRNIIVPKFMLNIFSDGGATVNVFTFGPEFSSRKNKFEYDLGFSYMDYSMNEFMFKGKGDGNDAWEVVSSDMKVLLVNVDILYEVWKHDSGMFSFMVGAGFGLGGVLGNIYRTQAIPDQLDRPNPDDVNAWTKCRSHTPGMHIDPTTGNTYCDASNAHYQQDNGEGYSEPSWANGGAKPFLAPWIALPQLSFRFKPVKQFQARADLGFSVSGFYFGLSAAYGL